jgi:competence protein ComEC
MGTLVEDPRVFPNRQRFLLRGSCVLTDSSTLSGAVDFLVTARHIRQDTTAPELWYGTTVAVRGRISLPPASRNPGEFNTRRFYEANGIGYQLFVEGFDRILRLHEGGGAWVRRTIIAPLRRQLLRLIENAVGGEEGELLKGLLLGERSGIQPETNEAFIRSGVAHVLAVSGSNVVVVAGFLAFIIGSTGCPRRIRFLPLGAGLIGYMLLSGTQPPVVRATVMGLVALASSAIEVRLNVLNALGVAALVILSLDTRGIFDIGFQLSFGAVLSLIILYPPLDRLIRALTLKAHLPRPVRSAMQLAAVSLAATLGTIPLTAGAFGRVSIIGILANLVVVPAVEMSVLLGGIMAIAAIASNWLGEVYGAVNWVLLHYSIVFTRMCAEPSFASISAHWFTTVDAIPYYVGLALLFSLRSAGQARILLPIFLASLNCSLLLRAPLVPANVPGHARISVIDVGQGDAVLVETPRGKRLLIDCGPSAPGSDAGKLHILPFLRRHNVSELDALVLTHAHLDHTGGLRSVLDGITVDTIFASPALARTLSRFCGRTVTPIREGMNLELDSSIRCYVLSPSAGELSTRDSMGNPSSVVLRLVFGKTSVLLTGDAGMEVEDRLLQQYGDFLRSDVLKVGHHGSATSTSEHFLSAVRPACALISVGVNNRFNHPADVTLARLRNAGIAVRRTDNAGAILMDSNGDVVSEIAWN